MIEAEARGLRPQRLLLLSDDSPLTKFLLREVDKSLNLVLIELSIECVNQFIAYRKKCIRLLVFTSRDLSQRVHVIDDAAVVRGVHG